MDDGPHVHVATLHLQQDEPAISQYAFHWHVHTNPVKGITLGLMPVM